MNKKENKKFEFVLQSKNNEETIECNSVGIDTSTPD